VIRQYISSALTLIVQLVRLKGGERKAVRISEIVGLNKKRRYVVRDIFGFEQTGIEAGRAVGNFYATGKAPRLLDRLRASGMELDPNLFTARTIDAHATTAGALQ
jgi:pilus assembly protein CpaF